MLYLQWNLNIIFIKQGTNTSNNFLEAITASHRNTIQSHDRVDLWLPEESGISTCTIPDIQLTPILQPENNNNNNKVY